MMKSLLNPLGRIVATLAIANAAMVAHGALDKLQPRTYWGERASRAKTQSTRPDARLEPYHKATAANRHKGERLDHERQDGAFSLTLNNLDGAGGLVLNPSAYTVGSEREGLIEADSLTVMGRPQAAAWYASLMGSDLQIGSASAAITLAERLEVSAGYRYANYDNLLGDLDLLIDDYYVGTYRIDGHCNIYALGAKFRALDEDAFDTAWVPAIAIGGTYRYNDEVDGDLKSLLDVDDYGFEAYAVATKRIAQSPWPILLTAGLRWSNEFALGLAGYGDYGVAAFGGIDVQPIDCLLVGMEYRQGIDADHGREDEDYYDVHCAWNLYDNLKLVAAWMYTGEKYSWSRMGKGDKIGFGNGFALSLQYQF